MYTADVLFSYRPNFDFFDTGCPISLLPPMEFETVVLGRCSFHTLPVRLSSDEEQGVAVMLQIWGQSVQASSNAPL